MNRSDERKETGASLARTPSAARAAEASHTKPARAQEKGEPVEHGSEGAAMARSPGAARSATSRSQGEQGGRAKDTEVRSNRGMPHKSIDVNGSSGGESSAETIGAEGFSDDASPKANKKEAYEPEREADEKAAISRTEVRHSGPLQSDMGGHEPPHRNTMGNGERATVGKNTI